MQILDVLLKGQGAGTVEALAKQFGVSPEQAAAVVKAVVPQLSAGIERNTLNRGGIADIIEALGKGGHDRYLDDPAALGDPATRADGDGILGHILGSKDRSRGVAAQAALSSGLSESLIKMMLPIIAAMVMGALGKAAKGGLGDILSKIPGAGGGGQIQSPEMPRFPQPQGGGGGQSPLPLPRGLPPDRPADNPYGDLSDILRRGGGGVSGGAVRDILGQVLGFESKGILGWIIRFIVVKFGWGILRSILGRLFLGR